MPSSLPVRASELPAAFVFNGDADGVLSQHLLLMSGVTPKIRITGVKRDIALLSQLVPDFEGEVYVFDIAFGPNAPAALALLNRKTAHLTWYDHHESGLLPSHAHFTSHIHAVKGQCTALIVNAVLGHAYPLWTAAAAFGDNLESSAEAILRTTPHSTDQTEALRNLGLLLNYNAYGEIEDVLYPAQHIAEALAAYADPFEFYRASGFFEPLFDQMRADSQHFQSLQPAHQQACALVYHIPNTAWARRYGASWANAFVRTHADKAIAVFTDLGQGQWQASFRAARIGSASEFNAGLFAGLYPSGGGRPQAAGINLLPENELSRCTQEFLAAVPKP